MNTDNNTPNALATLTVIDETGTTHYDVPVAAGQDDYDAAHAWMVEGSADSRCTIIDEDGRRTTVYR